MGTDWTALARGVTTLTFDCYGTLIDWERGLLAHLRPMMGARAGDEELLAAFAALEREVEAGSYLPYREVLGRVMDELAGRFGVKVGAAERGGLAESLPRWPAFPDTVESLRHLRRRFTLGVISNVDDDLFAATLASSGMAFDWVVTAQQCRSYKPSRNNFETALRVRALDRGQILHIAQSLYHDAVPCRELGIRCV